MKRIAPIIPKAVRKVSKLETKSLTARGVKLMEEAGELAAEILRVEGEKNFKGKSKEQVLYDLHLEAVDTMLMAMDILVHTGATDKRIKEIMKNQMEKWKDRTR